MVVDVQNSGFSQLKQQLSQVHQFSLTQLQFRLSCDLSQLQAKATATLPQAAAQREPNPDKATEVHLLMYVDDGKLYVSSQSLENNITYLKEAYNKAEEWLKNSGLSPDYVKRELMHYTRRKKDGSPSMSFDDGDDKHRAVKPESTVRWLRVYFDRKLCFQKHANILAARGENTVSGLTMLTNTVHGLSQTHLCHIYLVCVSPKILYACPVWWTGHQYQIKPLKKVQRYALRLICAAFCTTPIEALEVKASIPPIKPNQPTQKTLCHLLQQTQQQQPNHPETPPTMEKRRNPVHSPTLKTQPQQQFCNRPHTRTTNLLEIAKQTCHSHERLDPYLTAPWQRTKHSFSNQLQINVCKPETKEDKEKQEITDSHKKQVQKLEGKEDCLIIYTVSSLIKKKGFPQASTAVVGYHKGEEIFSKKLGMGGRAGVYNVEMAGLMMGTKLASRFTTTHLEIKQIVYFVDNSAAAGAIFDPKPQPG